MLDHIFFRHLLQVHHLHRSAVLNCCSHDSLIQPIRLMHGKWHPYLKMYFLIIAA